MTAVYVYRCYNANNRLLYVGASRQPRQRWNQHLGESHWAPLATRWSMTVYRDRAAALIAEHNAIQTEYPLFNRQPDNAAARRLWPQHVWVERIAARRDVYPHFAGDLLERRYVKEYRALFAADLLADVDAHRAAA